VTPYLLDAPAVVSFSGGRTSGFMLRHILDAFGGELPADVKVCFQNTGLEHAATYTFVERVSQEWGVEITWLEYRVDGDNQHDYAIVTPETASRAGEPFTALIQKKQYLPNPRARICTTNLKIRTLDRHLKGLPGFADGYTNAVGLRYDEPHRVHRMKLDNGREEVVWPLYEAQHTLQDVESYWRGAPFDLELPFGSNLFGNCVGCFLKGRAKLELIAQEEPEALGWWVGAEALPLNTKGAGGRFRNDRPRYAALLAQVRSQGLLFQGTEDDSRPCMCHD